jgi:hypothetical protein
LVISKWIERIGSCLIWIELIAKVGHHIQSLTMPDSTLPGFLKKYSSFLIRNLTRSDLLRS